MARRGFVGYPITLALILSFALNGVAFAAPDTTMSITPTATSGETISAADENARNNEISSKYNAHSHTDVSTFTTNTFTIGDNAVGNKTYAVNTDQANDPGVRYNTSLDLWTLSNDGATYRAVAHADTNNGFTSGAMLYGGSTSGAILSAGNGVNGQILIAQTGGAPMLGNITGSGAISVTNGPGTIAVDTTFATPGLTLGTANSAGVATTLIRSDATVAAFDATAPSTQAFGDAASAGSAAVAARRDHVHGMPASTAWAFVESLSTASGSSVTSATLPTDSDLFKVVFENVAGSTTAFLTFTNITNHLSIVGTTTTSTADNRIAEFGAAGAESVNGVIYVPRLATGGDIACPASVTFLNSGGTFCVLLMAYYTSASNFTTFTFSMSTGNFTAGKIHIYKSIPS
jgi:hypothetical protein